jgi:hypothetical protein
MSITKLSEFLSLNNATTAFRPTDVVFSQNGTALYIIDWGNVTFTKTGPVTTPNSGGMEGYSYFLIPL